MISIQRDDVFDESDKLDDSLPPTWSCLKMEHNCWRGFASHARIRVSQRYVLGKIRDSLQMRPIS